MNGDDKKRKKDEISQYRIDPNILREISIGVSACKSDKGKKNYLHNELTSKFGEDYKNLVDVCGDTLVHVSSYHGYFDLCKFLIESGFNIDKPGDRGATSLHELVYGYQAYVSDRSLGEEYDTIAEHLRLLQFFLEKGANVNLEDDYGYSAVDIMVVYDNFDMMDKVFESGVMLAFNSKKRSNAFGRSDCVAPQSSSEASSDQGMSQPSTEKNTNTNHTDTDKIRVPSIKTVVACWMIMGLPMELLYKQTPGSHNPFIVDLVKQVSKQPRRDRENSDVKKGKQNSSEESVSSIIFTEKFESLLNLQSHCNSQK